MTDQIPNTNPVPTAPVDRIKQFIKPMLSKFKQSRFYTNKKIFYPLSIAFCLIFLTILVGLLFGGARKTGLVRATPSPTPFVSQISPSPTPSGDVLSQIGQKLFDIKTQINALDVKQSQLQPPTINFKISF